MAIILDTYNVMHAGIAMGGGMADANVRMLCRWIVQTSRRGVTLVLDGRPKPDEPSENEFPELRLVYSGAGISADTVIAQLVERSTARRGLLVVTNDRAVAAQARRKGARTQSSEAFLLSLMASRPAGRKAGGRGRRLPTEKMRGLTEEAQTEQWLREFGFPSGKEPGAPSSKDRKKPKDESDDPDGLDMKRLMGF